MSKEYLWPSKQVFLVFWPSQSIDRRIERQRVDGMHRRGFVGDDAGKCRLQNIERLARLHPRQ